MIKTLTLKALLIFHTIKGFQMKKYKNFLKRFFILLVHLAPLFYYGPPNN